MAPRSTSPVILPDRSVPRIARYTWSRQWKAEVFAGLVEGTGGLAAFAAMRSLHAGAWIAPLFVTIGQLFWLVAPAWEAAFARFHIRRAFLWMGLVANVPLLCVVLVDPGASAAGAGVSWGLALFAVAIVVQAAVDAAYIPHRAALLRANYSDAVRGRMFGLLSTISKASSIVASKTGGWLLDRDPQWMRFVFPFAGLCGILEHWQLSRIRWHRDGRPAVRRWTGPSSAWAAAADAWREAWRILAQDAGFRRYELGFMLYGLGFLMASPMVVVYAEDDLRLTYGAWTWAQGATFPAVYIATILVFGRLVDRIGVVRISAWAFALLSLFFVAMLFVTTGAQLIAAYVLFGFVMAAVNLGWNLGPLAFAPQGKARAYSTLHMLCVGVRSAIAPFAGLWIAAAFSRQAVFAVAAAFVATGFVALRGLVATRR